MIDRHVVADPAFRAVAMPRLCGKRLEPSSCAQAVSRYGSTASQSHRKGTGVSANRTDDALARMPQNAGARTSEVGQRSRWRQARWIPFSCLSSPFCWVPTSSRSYGIRTPGAGGVEVAESTRAASSSTPAAPARDVAAAAASLDWDSVLCASTPSRSAAPLGDVGCSPSPTRDRRSRW